MGPLYVSDKQLAQRYSVTRKTIWSWVSTGLLPRPKRLSPKCTRWRLDQIEQRDDERDDERAA